MSCRIGINNLVKSVIKDKPWFSFNEKENYIEVLDSPNNKINRNSSFGVAKSLSEKLNKVVNNGYKQIGDVFYPNYMNQKRIVEINPSKKQLDLIKATNEKEILEIEAEIKEEQLQKEFDFLTNEANISINYEGDITINPTNIVQITEDNKISVDLLRGVSEQEEIDQQEIDQPYYQLASNLVNPAIEELDKYLLDFLKGFNVKSKEFEELKSRLGVNALGATDVLNKLIWYVKNRNEETLPEEAAHMIVALMGEKNPDIIELLANIKNWSEYEAIKNQYLPIYNDENKVKIEAVGKLIAKALVKNYKANGLDKNKLQKALDNIINFIEEILSSLSFNNVFMYNESVADHIAINVLSGNKDYIYKIKNLNSNLNAIQEINNNPHAKEIINTFSSKNVKMTGSLAIAGTENIRRPEGQGIHDIDFKVKNFEIFENEVEAKIPSNAVPAHYGWHKKQYSTFAYLIPAEGYSIRVIERKDDFTNGSITDYKLYNEKNEEVEVTQLNLMSVDFFVYKEGSNQKDFDYSTEFIPASLVYEGKMSLGGKSNPYFFNRDKDQEDYVLRDPKSFIPFEKHIYYQLADESSIKPGVEELFDSNPELANIGTAEQYSQYLDSIFPDSQLKDIFYHRSNVKFEKFDNSKLNKLTGGVFDFAKESGLEKYGKNLYSVLLNVKKLGEGFILKNGEDGLQSTEMIFDGSAKDVYSVPDESQIHILGNKQDIEGFKEFVDNTANLENEMPSFQEKSVIDLLQDIISNRDISKAEHILDKLSAKFNIPWQWSTDPNEKGSIKNGVVYINKNSFTEDTLFHEFAHPFVEYLALNNPTVYKILASNSSKVVNAQTGKTVKEEVESKYGDYSKEDLEKEIITEAIGLAAIDQLTEENKPAFQSILDRFLNFISELFGFNVTLNTTFKEIADTIFDDTYSQDLAPYLQGNYFQRDNSLTRDQIEQRFTDWTNRFELDPIEHKYMDSLTDEILDSVSTVIIQPLYDARGSKLKTDLKSLTGYAYGAVFGTAEHNIIQFFIDQNLNDDKSIKEDRFYDVELLKANNLHIVDTITSDTKIPVKGFINDNIIQQSLQFVDNYLDFVKETYGEDAHIWTEQIVYDSSFPISKDRKTPLIGTADIVIVMNDGSYVVHDWKTTESKYANRPKEALQDIKKQAYKEQIGTYGKMIGGNFKGGIVYPIGANKGYNVLTKLPLFPQQLEFPQPDPLKADPTNFFLYPVTVSGDEKVIENSIEELIIKLRFLQKKIMNKEYSLDEEEEYYDRKKSSDEIERAIEDLETRKSFESILRYGLDLHNEIESILDEMNLDQVEKAQEQIMVYLQLPSYGEYLELKGNDLDKLVAFDYKTGRLFKKLDIKRTELLTKQGEAEGILELNKAEKKYSILGKLFKGISGISDIKTLALFHKLKSKLYNRADRKTKNDLSVINKLEKDLKDYGSKNGLSIFKVYHKFLRKNSEGKPLPKLIKRVKDEFYEDIYQAIQEDDTNKLSQYFDLTAYSEKLEEAIENYKVKYQDISERREFFPEEITAFRNRVKSTDTDENLIKQMRLDYYNRQLMKFTNNRTLIQNGKINQQAVNHLFRTKDGKTFIKDHIISFKESKIEEYYTSEFNEILNNPELKNFYDFLIQQNKYAQELNLIDYSQIYNFIPSVIASTIEQAERGDLGSLSTYDKLKRSVDVEFIDENTISKVVINPITNEPEYQVQKLMQNDLSVDKDGVKDYTNYSLDLGYVYALYSMELHNYSTKLDLAPIGDALINMEKTKSTIKTNKWSTVVKDENGNVIEEKLGVGGINETNITFVKESIERDVYGITHASTRDIAIPFFKFFNKEGKLSINMGKISGTKLLRGTVAFNSHTNLGLNTLSALGTYFGGTVNAYFEANRSDQMTKKDLIKASNASASIFSNTLMGDKHLTLINLLDPMMENENLSRATLLSSTKLRKVLNVNMLYELMRRADRAVQYNVALAVSMNYMIVNDELVNINEYIRANTTLNGKTYSQLLKEGNINSINEIRKEIEKAIKTAKETQSVYVLSNMEGDNLDTPLTDDHVDKLRTVIKKQNSQIIGNMSQRDKMGLKNYALGQAASQYRNWMPALLQQRFGSAEMDNDLNRLNWGKVRTTFNALVNKDIISMTKSLFFDINDIALGRIRSKYEELLQDHLDKGGVESSFETYENFVEYYIANVRSTLKELSVLISLAMLFSALASAMGWDDDDKKKSGAQKTSYKVYSKLMSELTFFYSPSQQATIFGNVLPVLNTVANVGKLAESLAAESWYNTKQGIFNIDETKNIRETTPTKYAFKLPVLKEATTWMAMFNDDFRKEYNITVQYK